MLFDTRHRSVDAASSMVILLLDSAKQVADDNREFTCCLPSSHILAGVNRHFLRPSNGGSVCGGRSLYSRLRLLKQSS
jgi:hypothetical protein